MSILIRNAQLFLDNAFVKSDLFIKGQKIAKIAPSIDMDSKVQVIEAKDLTCVPGFVDLHAHLREPGHEYRETIESGLAAAAHGGFTSVVCMANTLPVNDNAAVTQFILEKAREACGVRLYPVGAITQGLEGKTLAEIGEMKKAGIVAISDDGKTVMDARLVRRAMEYAKGFALPMIVHCEDAHLKEGTHMNEGRVSTELGFKASPNCTEDIIAAREIHLAKLTGCHVHITHVSSAGTLELVRQAKKEGLAITCDVTPHHLYFTDEAIKTFNTDFKVSPPLRTSEDRRALWQGLADGTIDAIATDHAPHADREKKLEFEYANCGMIGFETALNVALYLVEKKVVPLSALPRLLATRPAQIMGFPDASIAVGNRADLTLFDAQKEITISTSHFYSKSKNSPFIGETMKGEVRTTIVDGRIVYPFSPNTF